MSDLKKIIVKILVLVLDILLFAFQTVKQIILPTRKRKGNILSSLLNFFIGTIERLIHFEHGLFKMSALFKHKYFKHGLIIVTTLLFLISSFEWSGQQTNNNETGNYSQQLGPVVVKSIIVKKNQQSCYTNVVGSIKPFTQHNISSCYVTQTSEVKKYLFQRSFLI